MTLVRIVVGDSEPLRFIARLEEANAPGTCAAFEKVLPFRSSVVHCRWSGEAVWVPLGGMPQSTLVAQQCAQTARPGRDAWRPLPVSLR